MLCDNFGSKCNHPVQKSKLNPFAQPMEIIYIGGTMAHWFVLWFLYQKVWVEAPARVILIVLCSWMRWFILTVPHSTLGWFVQSKVKITQC